jgi:hypothetical protein
MTADPLALYAAPPRGVELAAAIWLAHLLPAHLSFRRVGGLTFAGFGRLTVSWCVSRHA